MQAHREAEALAVAVATVGVVVKDDLAIFPLATHSLDRPDALVQMGRLDRPELFSQL